VSYPDITAKLNAANGTRMHGFALTHVRELAYTAPRFLIRPLLETDSLALVFGDPGCGKSFLALDMSACVALGAVFHGYEVESGPVVYIAGEGHNGLSRRIRAWEIHNQASLRNAPLYVSSGPAALCQSTAAHEVARAVDEIASENGPPVLVVVDTVARNFGPGDENATQDMTAFIQAVDMIRAKHRATVLLVHHTGHNDKTRARGAMALKGALDAEYRMGRDESGVIRVEATKMKDAPHPEPLAFRLRTVELDIASDESITSAVLDCTSYEPPPKQGKAGRGKWQTLALEILHRLHGEYRTNREAAGHDPDGVRISVEAWRSGCIEAGMPRQRFPEVRKSLSSQDIIQVSHGFVHSL
jgi:hypothetical protein